MVFPRTGDTYLDHEKFRPVFEVAAQLGVPLYVHPGLPPRAVRDASFSGFDDFTNMVLSTGGWGWHADAGLAALRLILAGTFDRHPDLQLILGHWGEMLVPFADRADLLTSAGTHLDRRILDYITGNLHVTAGGVHSQRMMRQAFDVLGPDRVMYGADDPYGSAGYTAAGSAWQFVDNAPISLQDKAKFAHLNAEQLLLSHPRSGKVTDAIPV
jgi:hypothetical protein